MLDDKYFMQKALAEAILAAEKGEVPIGCVIVCNDTIIAKAHNLTQTLQDVTAHAEMQAFTSASNYLGAKYLKDCTLYVTLEPCPMCAGAISQSRIKKIYVGAKSNIACNEKVIADILQNDEYYHRVAISYLNNEKCSQLLTEFFANKR